MRPRAKTIDRAGLGYVTFALHRPQHFTVMFDAATSNIPRPRGSTLLGFVKSCLDAERLPSRRLRRMALLAWTMVDGIAKLAISGRLPFRSNAEVLKFGEFVIDQSLPVSR